MLPAMKPTLLFATLSMVLAAPAAFAKSELETLRSLCLEQERQIRQLEDENTRLRSDSGGPRYRPAPAASILSSATGTQTIVNPTPAAASTYTVKAGDSLEKIARKLSTSPDKLAKFNGLKTTAIIQPGQKLKVPGTSSPATTAAAVPSSQTNDKTHTVKAGETYSSISRKYKISAEALAAANPTVKATALRPGQVIQLRADASPVAQTKTPEPVEKSPAAQPSVPTPAPATTAATEPPAAAPTPAAEPADKKLHPVMIEIEMTYGAFAALHGTNTDRLNALNGLDLTEATILAKGSELYVPAQP